MTDIANGLRLELRSKLLTDKYSVLLDEFDTKIIDQSIKNIRKPTEDIVWWNIYWNIAVNIKQEY
jgi:hypothetical protein